MLFRSNNQALLPTQRQAIPDPIQEGLASGWRVMGGPHAPVPDQLDCDVLIIGSGAGGGVSAEILSRAGLQVLLVEEGPLRSSSDFHQLESEAYPSLYQESAARTAWGASAAWLAVPGL